MRDVFTKKKTKKKRRKEKKERRRRKKIEFRSLEHLHFEKDKVLYRNLSK
jgi:hypothetical protein